MSDVVGRLYAAKDARQVKRVARAALALTVAVGLVGCGEPLAATASADKWSWQNPARNTWILTDHETGCQYVIASGVTPRLDATGKPMCGAP